MTDVTFQQDPQLANEKFVLQENTLLIIRRFFPRKSIGLASISPRYERIERRFHRGYLVPLILAAAFAVTGWRLFQGDHQSMVRAISGGTLGFMAFIFPFLMKFAPVEAARFVDQAGVALFEIYRPSRSAHTYDEFISALIQRVKASTERPVRT